MVYLSLKDLKKLHSYAIVVPTLTRRDEAKTYNTTMWTFNIFPT